MTYAIIREIRSGIKGGVEHVFCLWDRCSTMEKTREADVAL